MRHDEENRIFAYQAKQVFNDVEVEPALQQLDGEKFKYKTANIKADARSDLQIICLWTRQQHAFFDFLVFYPFTSSDRSKTHSAIYRSIAKIKKRKYENLIINGYWPGRHYGPISCLSVP